jgi:hypothetical protein
VQGVLPSPSPLLPRERMLWASGVRLSRSLTAWDVDAQQFFLNQTKKHAKPVVKNKEQFPQSKHGKEQRDFPVA